MKMITIIGILHTALCWLPPPGAVCQMQLHNCSGAMLIMLAILGNASFWPSYLWADAVFWYILNISLRWMQTGLRVYIMTSCARMEALHMDSTDLGTMNNTALEQGLSAMGHWQLLKHLLQPMVALHQRLFTKPCLV